MKLQILIIVLFAANILLFWSLYLIKKNSWYNLLGSILFIVLPLLPVFFSQPRFDLDYFWWRVTAPVTMLAGAALLAWSLLECRKCGVILFGVPSKIVTSGPYLYLRHPQYLALILINVGWWWLWAAAYAFYFGMFILALIWAHAWLEEKLLLEKKFGDMYRVYRSQTGMFWVK